MKNRLLVLVAVLIVGALLISGCEGRSAEDLVPSDEGNPEQVVLQFIAALRALDLEKAKSLTSGDYLEEFEKDFDELALVLAEDSAEGDLTRELFSTVLNNIDLEVTGHTIIGDEAIVNTISTHPDNDQLGELLMARMFEVMFGGEMDIENMTDEEGMELLLGIFGEVIGEVDRVTSEADVPMIKEDGKWKINGDVISDIATDLDF